MIPGMCIIYMFVFIQVQAELIAQMHTKMRCHVLLLSRVVLLTVTISMCVGSDCEQQLYMKQKTENWKTDILLMNVFVYITLIFLVFGYYLELKKKSVEIRKDNKTTGFKITNLSHQHHSQ